MTKDGWNKIPLLRAFISVDTEDNDLVRHEVRRDPSSGLTLHAKFKLNLNKDTAQ